MQIYRIQRVVEDIVKPKQNQKRKDLNSLQFKLKYFMEQTCVSTIGGWDDAGWDIYWKEAKNLPTRACKVKLNIEEYS